MDKLKTMLELIFSNAELVEETNYIGFINIVSYQCAILFTAASIDKYHSSFPKYSIFYTDFIDAKERPSDTKLETESDTKPGTESDTKPGTESDTKPGTPSDTTPETESDTKLETESDTKLETESIFLNYTKIKEYINGKLEIPELEDQYYYKVISMFPDFYHMNGLIVTISINFDDIIISLIHNCVLLQLIYRPKISHGSVTMPTNFIIHDYSHNGNFFSDCKPDDKITICRQPKSKNDYMKSLYSFINTINNEIIKDAAKRWFFVLIHEDIVIGCNIFELNYSLPAIIKLFQLFIKRKTYYGKVYSLILNFLNDDEIGLLIPKGYRGDKIDGDTYRDILNVKNPIEDYKDTIIKRFNYIIFSITIFNEVLKQFKDCKQTFSKKQTFSENESLLNMLKELGTTKILLNATPTIHTTSATPTTPTRHTTTTTLTTTKKYSNLKQPTTIIDEKQDNCCTISGGKRILRKTNRRKQSKKRKSKTKKRKSKTKKRKLN